MFQKQKQANKFSYSREKKILMFVRTLMLQHAFKKQHYSQSAQILIDMY